MQLSNSPSTIPVSKFKLTDDEYANEQLISHAASMKIQTDEKNMQMKITPAM